MGAVVVEPDNRPPAPLPLLLCQRAAISYLKEIGPVKGRRAAEMLVEGRAHFSRVPFERPIALAALSAPSIGSCKSAPPSRRGDAEPVIVRVRARLDITDAGNGPSPRRRAARMAWAPTTHHSDRPQRQVWLLGEPRQQPSALARQPQRPPAAHLLGVGSSAKDSFDPTARRSRARGAPRRRAITASSVATFACSVANRFGAFPTPAAPRPGSARPGPC
jgi:hypothetical protein